MTESSQALISNVDVWRMGRAQWNAIFINLQQGLEIGIGVVCWCTEIEIDLIAISNFGSDLGHIQFDSDKLIDENLILILQLLRIVRVDFEVLRSKKNRVRQFLAFVTSQISLICTLQDNSRS